MKTNLKKLFSKEEIKDIAIAVLVLTYIFWFVLLNRQLTIFAVSLSFFTVVISFLFHELAHKFVARKLGFAAAFKMFPSGLLFAIIFSFARIIIAAPGAVVIYPYRFGRWGYKISRLTLKEEGLISFVGPAVNIIFAAIFKIISGDVASFLAAVNALLAFFNLLPIPPLDGSKVLRWKIWFWFFMILISFLLAFVL